MTTVEVIDRFRKKLRSRGAAVKLRLLLKWYRSGACKVELDGSKRPRKKGIKRAIKCVAVVVLVLVESICERKIQRRGGKASWEGGQFQR